MSLFDDETGSRSSARILTWIVVLFTLALIWRDASSEAFSVPGEAYIVLTSLLGGLILWAAGPRIAQHVAPVFSGAARALGEAVKARNARRDPELGIEVTK